MIRSSAVSYTHLDHERKGNEGQQGNIVGDEHASEKAQPDQHPVSYTHLDVYKRQEKHCAGDADPPTVFPEVVHRAVSEPLPRRNSGASD